MKKLSLILAMVFFAFGFVMAQRTVTGTISDEKGEALVGASVVVKGTTNGALTDIDGKFSLAVQNGATTLVVSFTGYESAEVTLGASNVVDVQLKGGSTMLTETVVTALGISRSQKALGYAAQQVGGDKLVESNTTNIVDALTGKVAGVQITSSAGVAGASSRIVLRGPTSLNGNNQALIVVDGLRIDNSQFNTEDATAGVAQSNRAIDINPNDIESMTILKGAAASALYGVDGARGVVMITTKKGNRKGKKGLTVEYSTTYTATQVNKFPELQRKFAKGANGNLAGVTSTASTSWGPLMDTMYFDGVSNEFDRNGNLVGRSNPLAKLDRPAAAYDPFSVFQTGSTWQHNVAITGGDADKISYRAAFNSLKEEGIVPKNTFDRTNISLGTRGNLLDNKFHFNSTVQYIQSNSRRIQQGSNISGLMLGLLRTPPSFDNSNGSSNPVNDPAAYYLSDGRQRTYRNGTGYDNPYWVINQTPYTDEVHRILGNVDLTYDLLPWLKINGKVGTDVYQDNRLQKFEINSRTAPAGRIIDDRYTFRSIDAYLNLLGSKQLNDDWNVSYTFGGNLYTSLLDNLTVQGDGLGYAGFVNLNNAATKNTTLFSRNQKSVSLLGSVDIGYKSFLYFGLTGRNDWVSNMIVPSKAFKMSDISFFYPSANMSFVFSELLKQSWLDYGKLRVSYGAVGGGAPNPYLTSTVFSVPNPSDGWTDGIKFPYGGLIGLTQSDRKGSTTLKPSLTTDFEVGLEGKFLKNRVSLDVSYYTRKSTDQILPVPIPSSTGFSEIVLNTGSLSTVGYDVVLGITPVEIKDFSWNINFNFTTWKTKVESLAEGVTTQFLGGFTGSAVYNIVGEEYGQIYGGAWLRTNTADGRRFDANLPYNPTGSLIIDDDPTSANYGRPLVDETARKLGNPNPKFLLGINNSFSYKGFTVSALIDIRSGGQMWNGTRGALNNFGMSRETEDRNATKVFEGVKASDGNANNIPTSLNQSWYTGLGSGFGPVAEQFIEEVSFTRLRQLNVSYKVNPKWLAAAKMSDLTVSFIGRNLWLSTTYNGVDPETSLIGNGNAQGMDYFNMPGSKSYAFGLSVKF